LSNSDLEKMVETSDEWITTRTGICERRIAADDECTSDMGVAAGRRALQQAGVQPDEIDLLIVATCTPDYQFPCTAALIQQQLGVTGAATYDFQAACTGYLYGLSMAKAFVESGMYRNILLVAAEKISAVTDYSDRSTCILFGDGAAASVVSSEGEGLAIEHVSLGGDGNHAGLLSIEAGGARNPASAETVAEKQHFIAMAGRELFKQAVRRMEQASLQCLEKTGVAKEELEWFIPHQANLRIIDNVAERLDVPKDRIYLTVQKYGNTSASSVPIALDELCREKQVSGRVLLAAFGAGLTWGAALLNKVTA
jgi:3-oxoacyl-[acyl-carrier-protein] synthase III